MAFWRGSGMNSTEYKRYHEVFMEHHTGSSAVHTFFCIFITVECTLFVAVRNKCSYKYEYFSIVLTMILAHTYLANYLIQFSLAISTLLLYELLVHFRELEIAKSLKKLNNFHTKHILSITCLRGLTYLITVFAILAVDFKIFPRHLAKTEKYGFSFMDTGVGLFVLMSGLVQKELHTLSIKTILKSNVKFITILFILGITRFYTVKSLDYQEHVTEYGVHWNFFFTLAVCKLSSIIILYFTNRALLYSVLVLVIHEYLLYNGLQQWVYSDSPRANILSANREGISSCLGYTSLYLFAVYIKQMLADTTVQRYKLIGKFIAIGILLWMLVLYGNSYRPCSRTLCNAMYCMFLGAILVTILSIVYFCEVVFQDKENGLSFYVPKIISICNENGLSFFLIANLLTGTINLSIQTLFVPTFVAFIILNCYMLTAISLAGLLKKHGFRI